MAELDTLLDSEGKENAAETRIKELSNKVKLTSQERDELKAAKEKSDLEKATAEKKASFYKDFSKLSAKYPGSAEKLDEIESKVMAGYDPEDATISVMAKAGKLSTSQPEKEVIAGGSASTAIASTGEKSISEMTRDEKRAALEQLERETGGLSRILEKKSLA